VNRSEIVKIYPGEKPGYYYFLYLYILNDKRLTNSLSILFSGGKRK